MNPLAYARALVDRLASGDRANYPKQLAVDSSNAKTVEFIKTTSCRCIAEIGIYMGHTSMELARYLDGEGELHLYDYDDRVADVAGRLAAAGYKNVRTFGSTYKLLDSYNWQLAKMIAQHPAPLYDYVFLDGPHTFAIDALAALLADRLLVVGGYIDFDDYEWTLAASPSMNPNAFPMTGKLYSPEQIQTQQVKMLVDLLFKRDRRYREVMPNKIFQKIA